MTAISAQIHGRRRAVDVATACHGVPSSVITGASRANAEFGDG